MSAGAGGPAQRVLARSADWGRAPSAHNTQPWEVTADGPDTLRLGWHADRVLEVGDPTRRDLFLSLGCVAEALAIVAADLGLELRLVPAVDRASRIAAVATLHPRPDVSSVGDPTPPDASSVGEGLPPDAPSGGDARFTVPELVARRTARGRYADPPVTREEVASVAGAAGLADGVRLDVLPDDLVRATLLRADRWTFEGPATGELRDWLRLDPGDPRYVLDGLSDVAMGLNRWESAGLRLALRPTPLAVLRRTGLSRALARSATTRPVGTVVALTAPTGLPDEAVLALGRDLLRTWLAAGRSGLSAHPLSQLLDCPATEDQVSQAAGGGRSPYAVFRLGRPAQRPARSHRLTDG
ncbi:hypothetical protein [Ornithinicoccus hortensis]|uniref:Nitroreductase family protein n=1 Tax=Ornithinicoccus hortensis TaxID=82346 RepID=A0A542YM42_9MICO|nr:hypothetical protein [Ornithinicoccus hortensis]TQL49158.1 hypothetical protein FB467_0223 [Ornithinicoccus hortensis]